jgi:hypothetical protein
VTAWGGSPTKTLLALTLCARASHAQPAPAPSAPPDATYAVSDEPPPVDLADDELARPGAPSVWQLRPLTLELQAGLGAPLGAVGLAVDYATSTGFSLNAGIGLGAATASPQAALGCRLRILLTRVTAVGAEGGVSVGGYADEFDCQGGSCPPDWRWAPAVFGNAGLMLETRVQTSWSFRWSFGASAILNVVNGECRRCDSTDEPSAWTTTVLYTAIAVGRTFAL